MGRFMTETSISSIARQFPKIIEDVSNGKLRTKKYSFIIRYCDDTKAFNYHGKFFFIGVELEDVPEHINIEYGVLKLQDVNEGAFVLGEMAGLRVSIASYTLLINPSDVPEVRKEVNTLKLKNKSISTLNDKQLNILYA